MCVCVCVCVCVLLQCPVVSQVKFSDRINQLLARLAALCQSTKIHFLNFTDIYMDC